MFVINNKMAKLLNNINNINIIDINQNLYELLNLEFEKKAGGIFFHGAYTSQYDDKIISQEYIRRVHTDISGMEISLNMIHIDDYVNSEVFLQSIAFLKRFIEKWTLLENSEFLAIVSFQDDDVGTFSKFSFHKIRPGEMVYDINNIDKFLEAVMIYISDISAFNPSQHL
ncbi:hypothetical protein NKT77_05635 [Moraxella sp. FZLJ2107]|uniref:hypothetical protein n=1 Tax=unclassified Moraxella TaxID=2685852 RepID=UPI0020C84F0F|nr:MULTISPECIES: hypothetical protein [unclassified Moraxella]UTO04029.1 hypothetical protein NKT77_05635 [Moraxella sp. FZLJ2107]UTO22861.1 hypothetical protein NKU06_02415 [Moraxella sp. FZLJ2109]